MRKDEIKLCFFGPPKKVTFFTFKIELKSLQKEKDVTKEKPKAPEETKEEEQSEIKEAEAPPKVVSLGQNHFSRPL